MGLIEEETAGADLMETSAGSSLWIVDVAPIAAGVDLSEAPRRIIVVKLVARNVGSDGLFCLHTLDFVICETIVSTTVFNSMSWSCLRSQSVRGGNDTVESSWKRIRAYPS